jgi:hypothetical protein
VTTSFLFNRHIKVRPASLRLPFPVRAPAY